MSFEAGILYGIGGFFAFLLLFGLCVELFERDGKLKRQAEQVAFLQRKVADLEGRPTVELLAAKEEDIRRLRTRVTQLLERSPYNRGGTHVGPASNRRLRSPVPGLAVHQQPPLVR